MTRPVFEYEVELRIRDKKTDGERLERIRLWAYSVTDAVTQACYSKQLLANPNNELIGIDYIGPPQETILAAMTQPVFTVSEMRTNSNDPAVIQELLKKKS